MPQTESEAKDGIWIGRWVTGGQLVIYDPNQQTAKNTMTFFKTDDRALLPILANRVAGRVTRLVDVKGRDAIIESYQEWLASQPDEPVKPTRSGKKKSSAGGYRINPAFADSGSFEISEGAFEADWKKFGSMFPQHFEDPLFDEQEREHKNKAHTKIVEALDRSALESGSEEEVTNRFQRAGAATDILLFRTEHAAFHGGLKLEGDHRKRLFNAFHNLMWGEGDEAQRFTTWADAVEALPSTGNTSGFKWPVITAIPFFLDPTRHCALKPKSAQDTAKRYRINLRYMSNPNYITYARWLEIVEAIEIKLYERGARDRLDVYSFIWRVSQ